MENNISSNDTYEVSLLHYQVATNSAVNRDQVCVINNLNNSSYYLLTNNVIYNFCKINELSIWFKIKITDNCFNFIWG